MVKKRILIPTACLVILVGLGGSAFAWHPSLVGATAQHASGTASFSTVPVERGDLTETHTFSGTLGFGTPIPVPAAAGTLTWLPKPGDVIGRDQPLYAVDGHAVRVFHGATPMWRDLRQGVSGDDVTQLTQNLQALGYDLDVDDAFGPHTRAAVEAWQRDRGLDLTGVLSKSDIVFVPSDVRVSSVSAVLGENSGGSPLSVTGTTRVVTAAVPERDSEYLAVGVAVGVVINGVGDEHPGEVVDATPTTSDDGSSAVKVTVVFDAGKDPLPPAATAQLRTQGHTETNVLHVPVSALIAGDKAGTYVVEVPSSDGDTQRIPVQVGFVAAGRVAVSGKLKEGDEVVVPR